MNLIDLVDSIEFSSSFYDRLLNEQARRLYVEKNLQSFETLNIEQLKDRLTRVENTNQELHQLILHMINRKPVYRNTLFIRHVPH